jgi:hypothetical protein
MIQRGDRASFALEALVELVLRELDGDDAIEPRVASFPHLSHPACANLREDLIGV